MLTYRGNPYCGGQGVYVSYLGAELAKQGHEVHVISGPPYPHHVEGVTVHRVPGMMLHTSDGDYPPLENPLSAFSPLNLYDRVAWQFGMFSEMASFSFRAFALLRRLHAHYQFDVIHDNQTLGWGLLPMKLLGAPLLATIHHPLTIDRQRGFEAPTNFHRQWGQMMFHPILMQGFVARRIPHVVTVSDASAKEIIKDFRVPQDRIQVVYNGVDTAHFRPLLGRKRVSGRVLYVGNFQDPNKGSIFLLRAMARVKRPSHLVIAAATLPDPERFRQDLEDLGLADRVEVRLQLDRDELVELYATAEVAVSPSVFEGFGFPAAEAMACGLPVVAAAGGALPEVVGDAGLVVPPRDPEAMAAAIDKLLGDASLREAIGKSARERILERFQWHKAASEMTGIYQDMIYAHR